MVRYLSYLVVVGLLGFAGNADARGRLVLGEVEDRTGTLEATVLESLTEAARQRAGRRYLVLDDASVSQARARLQRRGACKQGSCLKKVAIALRASAALKVQVATGGTDYALTAELLQSRSFWRAKRAQLTIPMEPPDGRSDRLLAGLRSVLDQLFNPTRGTATSRAEARREARREARERRRERSREAALARRERYAQRRLRKTRTTKLIYGIMGVGGAAIAAAAGVYFVTAGISRAEDDAAKATSAKKLAEARDEARSNRTKGIVMFGLAAVAGALGAWMLLSMPSLPPRRVAGVSLDRLPAVGPTASGGVGMSWGGRF